jgi:hypothetical protein
MATICKTCRFYGTNFYYSDDLSSNTCHLSFPPWIYQYLGLPQTPLNKAVDELDTCDFWNIDKGNN